MQYRSVLFTVMLTILLTLASVSFGQGRGQNPGQGQGRGGGQGRGQQAPARPAPRFPDGQINLGQVSGEAPGLWDAGPTNIPLARPDKASDFGLFAADAREPAEFMREEVVRLEGWEPTHPYVRSLLLEN